MPVLSGMVPPTFFAIHTRVLRRFCNSHFSLTALPIRKCNLTEPLETELYADEYWRCVLFTFRTKR